MAIRTLLLVLAIATEATPLDYKSRYGSDDSRYSSCDGSSLSSAAGSATESSSPAADAGSANDESSSLAAGALAVIATQGKGFCKGWQEGVGFCKGWEKGMGEGYDKGKAKGLEKGKDDGYVRGWDHGCQAGKAKGLGAAAGTAAGTADGKGSGKRSAQPAPKDGAAPVAPVVKARPPKLPPGVLQLPTRMWPLKAPPASALHVPPTHLTVIDHVIGSLPFNRYR